MLRALFAIAPPRRLIQCRKNVTEELGGPDKEDISSNYISKLREKAGKLSKTVSERFQTMTAMDLTTVAYSVLTKSMRNARRPSFKV